MDGHHLHLALNHVPVFALFFGSVILSYGIWRAQDAVVRVALGLFVAGGVGAGAAFLTGEQAEEVVEGVAGIPESVIEAHEEMGLIALVVSAVVGGLALGVLIWLRNREIPTAIQAGLIILAIAATGILGYTANLGGQIRHVELRGGTDGYVQQSVETDHDEDD